MMEGNGTLVPIKSKEVSIMLIFFDRNIITCGSDGDYRIWKGYDDDDPECVRVGDEATAIAFKVSWGRFK